jgi:hypothetical protein
MRRAAGAEDLAVPLPRDPAPRRDRRDRDERAGRSATEASRSRLRAAPPEPVAAPRMPFVLLVLTLVAGGIVGLLVLNTAINTDAFKITALKDQQSKLDTQEQQLNQELTDLQSPGNLQAAATRLGLVPAGTPAYIHLPDGRIINVPRPAGSGSSAGR